MAKKQYNNGAAVDTRWRAVFKNRFTRRAAYTAVVMSVSAVIAKSGDIVAVVQGMLP